MTDTRKDDDAIRTTESDTDQVLVAETVVSATGPAECTIFPRDVPDGARMTTWITAKERSFVHLVEMR